VKLTSVPEHLGIDGNETADESARRSSSHLLTRPEPAIGIAAKVARMVIRDLTSRKHEEHLQSIRGQTQAKDLLLKNLCKNELGIAQPEQKLVKILTELVKKTLPITEYLFELGLVKSPECDRCKHASETTSHFCD